MTRFAEETKVSVSQSRAEIENLLVKHGASKFMSFFEAGRAVIAFGMSDRLIRFTIALPDPDEDRFVLDPRSTWKMRTAEAALRAFKQEERRIWRSLLLVIKAKLEAVESEITTFEQEFLPFIVLADNTTVGDTIIPQLGRGIGAIDIGRMLPAPKEAGS